MDCRLNLLILFLLFTGSSFGQSREMNYQVTRNFAARENMTLEINNKYGMVQVIHREQDSVRIVIDVQIKAKDRRRLERLRETVDFNFNDGQYFITARTVIEDSSPDFLRDLFDIAGTFFSSTNSVTVNYTLYVPVSMSLRIENRYGNVYLDDMAGDLDLVLSYGDLQANRLTGQAEIDLSSGNADIDFMQSGQVSVSYSDMQIEEAGDIYLRSNSSNVTVHNARELRLSSRRDKLLLGNMQQISGDTYFTDIHVESLHDVLNCGMRYGNLYVEQVVAGFSLINLTSELTDISIALNRPLGFSFDFTYVSDVRFVYPESFDGLKNGLINEEEELYRMAGNIGSGNTKSRVVMMANRKCDVIISSR